MQDWIIKDLLAWGVPAVAVLQVWLVRRSNAQNTEIAVMKAELKHLREAQTAQEEKSRTTTNRLFDELKDLRKDVHDGFLNLTLEIKNGKSKH